MLISFEVQPCFNLNGTSWKQDNSSQKAKKNIAENKTAEAIALE